MATNAEKEQIDNPLNLSSSELQSTESAPEEDSKATAGSRGRSRSRNRSRSRGRHASRSKSVVRSGGSEPVDQPEIRRRRQLFHVGRQSQGIGNDGQVATYRRPIF
ncbi:hypothetical protein MTO96_047321 [Rhipicephalus appendiculatus]